MCLKLHIMLLYQAKQTYRKSYNIISKIETLRNVCLKALSWLGSKMRRDWIATGFEPLGAFGCYG